MKLSRHFKNYLSAFIFITLFTISCKKDDANIKIGTTGTINIEITDAPIDNPEIRNAYVTLSGITVSDTNLLVERSTIDLLAYRNGNTKSLGNFEIPAKTYDHITLSLDLQEDAFGNIPGCYVATDQGKKHNLYPSNNLFKKLILPIDNLEILPDSKTNLLLDFDLRKLIRYGNLGTEVKYQFIDDRSMEESIRVLDKDKTGSLRGNFTNETGQDYHINVFVYESGTFHKSREIGLSETNLPDFFGAVNSGVLNPDGNIIIPFLPKGSYELVFTATSKGGQNEFIGLLDVTSSTGSDLKNLHVEPGNQLNVTGTISELLPY